MPQQWMLAELAPIEEVERTNAVMVCPQQRAGFAQWNSYTMDVDRRENWNCYNCREFGHLAKNCRNRGTGNRIGDGRRLEYRQSNLNGEGDLVVLN